MVCGTGDVEEGADLLAPHVLVRDDRQEERVPRLRFHMKR